MTLAQLAKPPFSNTARPEIVTLQERAEEGSQPIPINGAESMGGEHEPTRGVRASAAATGSEAACAVRGDGWAAERD
jgi:hypothetical protein